MRLENRERRRDKERLKIKELKKQKGRLTLTERVRALERAVFGEQMD